MSQPSPIKLEWESSREHGYLKWRYASYTIAPMMTPPGETEYYNLRIAGSLIAKRDSVEECMRIAEAHRLETIERKLKKMTDDMDALQAEYLILIGAR